MENYVIMFDIYKWLQTNGKLCHYVWYLQMITNKWKLMSLYLIFTNDYEQMENYVIMFDIYKWLQTNRFREMCCLRLQEK
jgi:hypothetical protein